MPSLSIYIKPRQIFFFHCVFWLTWTGLRRRKTWTTLGECAWEWRPAFHGVVPWRILRPDDLFSATPELLTPTTSPTSSAGRRGAFFSVNSPATSPIPMVSTRRFSGSRSLLPRRPGVVGACRRSGSRRGLRGSITIYLGRMTIGGSRGSGPGRHRRRSRTRLRRWARRSWALSGRSSEMTWHCPPLLQSSGTEIVHAFASLTLIWRFCPF